MTVLIWGSTWIGIKYQLGVIDPMVSIGHRFALSALLIFIFLWLRREPVLLSWRHHRFIALQGLCLFCMNYFFIYHSELVLTSGLVAVVFSTIVVLNILNSAIFLGQPVNLTVLFGAGLGLLGMVGVFWPELHSLDLSDSSFRALLYCFAGTVLASLGNMIAVRNQRQKIPVLVCNAWGMLYGAGIMYCLALSRGQSLSLEWTPAYLVSLVYLALFGSVIAFWAYITLMGRIGADRAGYSNLLFPLVALLISTLVESYQWSGPALIGVGVGGARKLAGDVRLAANPNRVRGERFGALARIDGC